MRVIIPFTFYHVLAKVHETFWGFPGDSRRRKWQPTPALSPGQSHGQRSLVDYSPWGLKESDRTEWLHFHSLSGDSDGKDSACSAGVEKEMATHSSVPAWRIPGTEEPGGLPSMGSHRVGHDWSDLAAAAVQETWICSLGGEDPLEKEMAAHFSILVWKTPWTEEPGTLRQSMGSQRVGHNWVTNTFFHLHFHETFASI